MTQPSADGLTPAAPDVAPARAVAQHRPAAGRPARAREVVTAVVVTRGVTAYLPRALAAVADQVRPPQRLLVVDAAPDARPGDLAAAPELQDALAALGEIPTRLVTAPGVRTFGGAVRAALADEAAAAADGADGPDGPDGPVARRDAPVPAAAAAWLWLLHDDAAAEPEALAALVSAVEVAPSVGVAGAKQRTWDDPARVLEVGVTTSRFGRRMTGIDEPEVDQGQHDAREDVLAVGLVGALVRRDVWDDLGGPDPALGPYGDGLDLCRRARLAGHRVVVVPGAVVRHAQASVTGGREGWDASRSARVRREAFVHGQLTSVPGWLVPVVVVLAVASGAVRALGRFATKEPNLVAGELVAPWRVLAAPGRIVRARRRARATSVLPRRTLRPLEATWRDVLGQVRDRRLTAAEARRARTAPSELELAELTALKVRRRWTLAAVAVAAVAVDLAVLGPLVGPVLGGARLSGGSLLFGDADLGGLWAAATSWWSAAGLGQASPPEPLLSALLPFVAVTGGVGGATALVLLGSLVLAALGAWFAAGAATRSVALRAWAALVWTAAPPLLVGLDQARLGAVLAHVSLPWFLLALARGVGAARVDSVASGLVGARRLLPREVQEAAVVPAADARPRYTFDDDATDADDRRPAGEAGGDGSRGDAAPDDHGLPDDAAGNDDVVSDDAAPNDAVVSDAATVAVVGPLPGPGRPPATGVGEPSLAAAAAAGLALVLLTAAAPVLLPAVLVLLLAVAPVVRRRARLLWVPVPALAVHGPVLAEAVTTWGDGGWRLLLADPGRPVAGATATPWQQLLGWPVPAESWAGVPWSGPVWDVAPLVASGMVLLLALPALWLRPAVGRAARVAWVAVAIGVAAAVAASGTVSGVAVGADGMTTATASASPGLSLALAGALAAALVGASGVRSALARRPLGWRHGLVGLVLVAAVAGPGLLLGTWAWHARADGVGLTASEVAVVPTVGRQLQSAAGLRVLELTPATDGVSVTVLEGNGPQMTETTRVVELRRLETAWDGGVDAADAELAGVAARLAGGASSDVSAALADIGVGAVLVPAGPGADRAVLAAALDATPGLERVTSTESGIIWRVAGATSGAVGWARVVEGPAGDAETVLTVPRGDTAQLPPGQATRTLELAERADAGWQATVDGRSLRSVETTWRQAFELPADGGELAVVHAPVERVPWLAVQGAVLLVTILLAVPLRRRKAVRR